MRIGNRINGFIPKVIGFSQSKSKILAGGDNESIQRCFGWNLSTGWHGIHGERQLSKNFIQIVGIFHIGMIAEEDPLYQRRQLA